MAGAEGRGRSSLRFVLHRSQWSGRTGADRIRRHGGSFERGRLQKQGNGHAKADALRAKLDVGKPAVAMAAHNGRKTCNRSGLQRGLGGAQ